MEKEEEVHDVSFSNFLLSLCRRIQSYLSLIRLLLCFLFVFCKKLAPFDPTKKKKKKKVVIQDPAEEADKPAEKTEEPPGMCFILFITTYNMISLLAKNLNISQIKLPFGF
jgi:hypothetical protein